MLVECDACGQDFNKKPSAVARAKLHFCKLSCKSDKTARFWRSVMKTDSCWIWVGGVGNKGYGRMRPARRSELAHRYSWELHNGSIPIGLCVCHNCPGGDNPLCVNPAHLFLGTLAENIADAVKKNQIAWGERSRHAKLRLRDIPVIRGQAKAGATFVKIATNFGVSPSAIRAVVHGKSWRRA